MSFVDIVDECHNSINIAGPKLLGDIRSEIFGSNVDVLKLAGCTLDQINGRAHVFWDCKEISDGLLQKQLL